MLSIIVGTNTLFASATVFATDLVKTPDSKSTSQSNPKSRYPNFTKNTATTISEKSKTVSKSDVQTSTSTSNTTQVPFHHHHHHHRATVSVHYVDQEGNLLATGTATYPRGPFVGRPYVTHERTFSNYRFVRMAEESLPAKGILRQHGDNGIVTYVYAPAYHLTTKTINESVKYVDDAGKEIAEHYAAKPVTFATVEDLSRHTTVTYYSTTKTTLTLDSDGAPSDPKNWTRGEQTTLPAVTNPTIKGYHVTSNSAPHSDHHQVDQQTINTHSSNLTYTVRYALDSKKVTVEFIDDRNNKILSSKNIQVYYNQRNSYNPTNQIEEYQKQGYKLIDNEFPKDGLDFEQIDSNSTVYYVHLRSKAPKEAKPQPIKPSEPKPKPSSKTKSEPTSVAPAKSAKPNAAPKKSSKATPTTAPTMQEKRIIVQKRLQQHALQQAAPQPKKHPLSKQQPVHVDFEFVNQPQIPKRHWIKIPSYMRRYWKFPSFTTPFALWTSELQPLYRKTGGDLHYTQLGLILKTMSGRMLVGQKYSK